MTAKGEPLMRSDPPHWTLDRRVPLSLIVAILLQTFGVAWWGATYTASNDARVKAVEVAQIETRRQVETLLLSSTNTAAALADLKGDVRVQVSETRNLIGAMERLEKLLESRLTNGGRP